jgi:hypothetical protein
MADSLVLKGVRDVTKHTGTEMLLTRPKRGGDTHLVKEWWKSGGVSTCYVNCTIFDVTVSGDTVKLVLDTNMSTDVRIDHDTFVFTFIGANEISRAALFTEDMQLIEHYVFPAISGGKIMTVKPAGAAPKPDGTAAETIGTPTVSGNDNPDADTSDLTYSVALSGGDASAPVYAWTVTGNLSITAGQGTASLTVDAGDAGDATVKCSVSQAGASNTPQEDTLSVTIA